MIVCCVLALASGCHHHRRSRFILPEEAAIARSAAYAAVPPPTHESHLPPVSHEIAGEAVFFPATEPSELPSAQPFEPMPSYFPGDGPLLEPAPPVEAAPAPINNELEHESEIEQMSGVCCCQRCQRLTEELDAMSQRVDDLTAMMETQRLTVASLNAALIRADANIKQLHDDIDWHRDELDRMRIETEAQQQRDVEQLQEIAEIAERLSSAP